MEVTISTPSSNSESTPFKDTLFQHIYETVSKCKGWNGWHLKEIQMHTAQLDITRKGDTIKIQIVLSEATPLVTWNAELSSLRKTLVEVEDYMVAKDYEFDNL